MSRAQAHAHLANRLGKVQSNDVKSSQLPSRQSQAGINCAMARV